MGTDDADVTPSEECAQKYAQHQSFRDNQCQDKCDFGSDKENSPPPKSAFLAQKTNASERTRTSTGYCPLGPKPSASANSATLAKIIEPAPRALIRTVQTAAIYL